MHTRLDLLEKAKVDYPKTWEEFIETSKKIQEPPRLFAFGICLGLTFDTTDNVMNLLWCYGGKMVEKDNKTIAMNSPENIAGLKVLEAMFKTHKIIPPGAISWDDSGNNKAYQSKQAAFVMNPTSVYAYLDGNDKDLQKVTGIFPVPAGPAGSISQIDTWSLGLFKKSPYPELGKGLIEYMLQPVELRQDRPVDRRALGARLQAALRQPLLEGEAGLQALHPAGGAGVPVSYAGSPNSGGGRGPEHARHRQDDPARPGGELAGREGRRGSPQGRSPRSTPGTPRDKLRPGAARARRERGEPRGSPLERPPTPGRPPGLALPAFPLRAGSRTMSTTRPSVS